MRELPGRQAGGQDHCRGLERVLQNRTHPQVKEHNEVNESVSKTVNSLLNVCEYPFLERNPLAVEHPFI